METVARLMPDPAGQSSPRYMFSFLTKLARDGLCAGFSGSAITVPANCAYSLPSRLEETDTVLESGSIRIIPRSNSVWMSARRGSPFETWFDFLPFQGEMWAACRTHSSEHPVMAHLLP